MPSRKVASDGGELLGEVDSKEEAEFSELEGSRENPGAGSKEEQKSSEHDGSRPFGEEPFGEENLLPCSGSMAWLLERGAALEGGVPQRGKVSARRRTADDRRFEELGDGEFCPP